MKHVPQILGLVCMLLAPSVATAQAGPNLVINGDFEIHTGIGCDTNLPNANFNAIMPFTTAFGAGSEIDVMDGSCFGSVVSGSTKIGISSSGFTFTKDELSLDLSAPVVSGATYELRISTYAVGTPYLPGPVEVGLSTSPVAFGTLIFTTPVPPAGPWVQFTQTFVAPANASYLTLSSGPAFGTWTHIDRVELRGMCAAIPSTYCTAKQNSLGCLPSIDSSGCASSTNSGTYFVTASQVRNQKVGLLLHGVSGRSAIPFQGGVLCVASPIRRTTGVSSGGTSSPSNDCSGVYSIDMNAFAAGNLGGNPLPALLIPGTLVDCQWWGRDPGFAAPNNTTLSNGLEYVVGS